MFQVGDNEGLNQGRSSREGFQENLNDGSSMAGGQVSLANPLQERDIRRGPGSKYRAEFKIHTCLLDVMMLALARTGKKRSVNGELMSSLLDMLTLNARRTSRWRCPAGSWKCCG